MDREGFRNRLKQYKLAREENPGLKYWEWKGIPKYDEGTHRVTAGESLSSIAKKYKLNLQDLIDYNPQIKNPNIIGIGQEINVRDKSLLPTIEWVDYRELRLKERDIADSTTTINYSVKSGDSLSKIAKDNGLTLKQLLMQNPQITDPNKISIGQNLSITTTKDGNMAAILSVSHRGNYVVVDKVNKKLTVYNKDNKPIYVTDNIATGASGNDYNTITYVDANGVIRNMQGNNSTPAGITEITGKGVYHGAKSFTRGRYNRLTGNFDDDIASSFHTGRIDIGSNGCVRLPKKELDDLNNLIKRGTKVYTLPEQEGSRFIKKDNKLSFVADSPYGTNTGKTKYWDDYNTYVDATYNPLAISYAGDYDGLSDEYINNSTAFANTLSSSKQALQKELGLDSATYNDLAELALGIAEQESNFGTSTRKKIKDMLPGGLLNSIKELTRGKTSARSVGMTQIKMSADNDLMQQFYKKHNITPDNILNSAELSAIATIGRLAHMYNNEVRGRTFTGENGISIDPIDAVLYKYMGKNKELTGKTATPEKNIYIQNVKKYAKDWDLLSQTESFAEGGEVGDEYFGNEVSTEDNPIYYKEQTAKEKYSDFVNKHGWTNIAARNARTAEASKYTIPYIPEKEIRLTTDRYNTGKISTNLLDSIYDSSQRVGIPFDVALGLAGRESTLGIGRGFKKGSDVTMTDLYSNWLLVQPVIASKSMTDKWNNLVRKEKRGEPLTDDDYAFRTEFLEFHKKALESTRPIKEHPIDNALKLYLTGRYNAGDKSYEQKVQKDARLVMSDPAIQKWAKEKGIALAEGGEVEPDPLEVLERSRPKVAGIPINDKPLSGTDPLGELYLNYISGKGVYKTIKGMKAGFDRKSLKSAYDYYHNDLRFPRKMAYDVAKARPYAVEGIDNLLNKCIELLKWN